MIATKLRLIAQKALGNEADTAEAKEILHTFNISVDFRDFRFERCKKMFDFRVNITILSAKNKIQVLLRSVKF